MKDLLSSSKYQVLDLKDVEVPCEKIDSQAVFWRLHREFSQDQVTSPLKTYVQTKIKIFNALHNCDLDTWELISAFGGYKTLCPERKMLAITLLNNLINGITPKSNDENHTDIMVALYQGRDRALQEVDLLKRPTLSVGSLQIDPQKNVCSWKNQPVPLSGNEMEIVYTLVQNPNFVFDSRILESALRFSKNDKSNIPSHIKRIRSKFKSLDPNFKQIRGVKNFGFSWIDDEKKHLSDPEQIVIGELTFSPNQHLCIWKGQVVELTTSEEIILQALITLPGFVLSHNSLLDALDPDKHKNIMINSIDTHIRRVRKKFITVDPNFEQIKTLELAGFYWQTPLEQQAIDPCAIKRGSFYLEPSKYQCFWDGNSIDLPPHEFEILFYLVQRPGFLRTRHQIKDTCGKNASDNSIDSTIKRIRKKLARADSITDFKQVIITHYGRGYSMTQTF